MNAFLIGLQFLTRISLVRQTVWTAEDFGRSVRHFPAVGAVLGLTYVLGSLALTLISSDAAQHPTLRAALVFAMTVVATGGIHCDGFMDSCDGLFSGRDRDRMLEIMKDSRVGAFGVVGFVTFAVVEVAALDELALLPLETFLASIYSMPILGRLSMTIVIGTFPYARAEGMGKAFSDATDGRAMLSAIVEAAVMLTPIGLISGESVVTALLAGVVGVIPALMIGGYATKKLGGVTGDIYGAAALLSELTVLIIFLLL